MQEKAWIYEYIRELEPKKRRSLLEKAKAEAEPEDNDRQANELRTRLLKARYSEVDGRDLDTFIRGLMDLRFLESASKSIFSKKKVPKQFEAIRKDWCMDLAGEYGETGEKVLYQEFCNMMRRYFYLCEEDRNYNSILLGIGRIKKESRIKKIAGDVRHMAFEIPEETKTAEELKLFTKAAADTFRAVYPEDAELLDNKK